MPVAKPGAGIYQSKKGANATCRFKVEQAERNRRNLLRTETTEKVACATFFRVGQPTDFRRAMRRDHLSSRQTTIR